ncbi:hypothetical protein BLNAU_15784 [Blattamonas nauphoetae]|uniref:Uncharacterized protein n=1 Tax=Blattamonas nauphoetae TaxID=2049346 RepID=A0ABQ9XA12_9EUKA|nr:hypothetical protein BLNAU_15784 [Blattamonas nauphoetae]
MTLIFLFIYSTVFAISEDPTIACITTGGTGTDICDEDTPCATFVNVMKYLSTSNTTAIDGHIQIIGDINSPGKFEIGSKQNDSIYVSHQTEGSEVKITYQTTSNFITIAVPENSTTDVTFFKINFEFTGTSRVSTAISVTGGFVVLKECKFSSVTNRTSTFMSVTSSRSTLEILGGLTYTGMSGLNNEGKSETVLSIGTGATLHLYSNIILESYKETTAVSFTGATVKVGDTETIGDFGISLLSGDTPVEGDDETRGAALSIGLGTTVITVAKECNFIIANCNRSLSTGGIITNTGTLTWKGSVLLKDCAVASDNALITSTGTLRTDEADAKLILDGCSADRAISVLAGTCSITTTFTYEEKTAPNPLPTFLHITGSTLNLQGTIAINSPTNDECIRMNSGTINIGRSTIPDKEKEKTVFIKGDDTPTKTKSFMYLLNTPSIKVYEPFFLENWATTGVPIFLLRAKTNLTFSGNHNFSVESDASGSSVFGVEAYDGSTRAMIIAATGKACFLHTKKEDPASMSNAEPVLSFTNIDFEVKSTFTGTFLFNVTGRDLVFTDCTFTWVQQYIVANDKAGDEDPKEDDEDDTDEFCVWGGSEALIVVTKGALTLNGKCTFVNLNAGAIYLNDSSMVMNSDFYFFNNTLVDQNDYSETTRLIGRNIRCIKTTPASSSNGVDIEITGGFADGYDGFENTPDWIDAPDCVVSINGNVETNLNYRTTITAGYAYQSNPGEKDGAKVNILVRLKGENIYECSYPEIFVKKVGASGEGVRLKNVKVNALHDAVTGTIPYPDTPMKDSEWSVVLVTTQSSYNQTVKRAGASAVTPRMVTLITAFLAIIFL